MTGWHEAPGVIIGRESERRALSNFLDAVGSGRTALVIEGEAGIGKSTILCDAVAQARGRGLLVLGCRPAAAEARMSFAALGDLLEPVIEELLLLLAEPQRRALEVALLRAEPEGSRRDERGVSVAFLNAIRLLCANSPVLVAVDDAQWLDRPTARVLDFALRRLTSAPVVLLASVRTGGGALADLELARDLAADRLDRMRLGPLSLAALHHVIGERQRAALPRRAMLRIHEVSGGNPFFALELAHALAARNEPLAPGEPLPVPATLGELVAGRLGRLPARGRQALLVVSAAAQPTPALFEAFDPRWEASEVLARAERGGLVEIGRGRVRFTHPLIASTVYGGATERERRRVHARLAEVVADPEQRARHLALAAAGPAERVARALEAAADIADARGAPEAAAELCELAREATPSDRPEAARRRNLAAADHHFMAGDWDRAGALAEQVSADGVSGAETARALHILAKVHYYGDSFPEAGMLLRRAVEQAGEDRAVRAPIEIDLAYVSHVLEGFPAAAAYARATVRDAEVLGQPGLLAEALAVLSMAEFLSAGVLERDRLERALALEDRARRVPVNLRPSLIAGMIFAWIGELERGCALLEDLRAWLIERGEEGEMAMMAAPGLVSATCWRGDLRAADRYARETFEVACQLETDASRALALTAVATANAYLGNVGDAHRQAHEAVGLMRAIGMDIHTAFPLSALGLLHLSLDEPAEVDRCLRPLVAMIEQAGLAEPSGVLFVADEIEALIGIGELGRAESLLDSLQTRAQDLDRAPCLATAWRCRGLLFAARGDHDHALVALDRALEQHDRAPYAIELARTLLVRGQVQRRANQRRAARETLERALSVFEETGAAQWARRARAELARLGLRRKAGSELTPTELQVAKHAASGMTNRQIAGTLFISPKTVEANLARVYRKLGISSRAELGRRIADRERPAASNA